MSSFQSRRNTFNAVAELYDEVRPGYSEAIIDDILAFAALPGIGRILEIGCGTGQITIPFAARGYPIVALEQASAMAAFASRKCQAYSNVRILELAFEDWPVERQGFHLVLSAQAFHWIEPEYGCSKAAEALRAGGTFALVWYHDRSEDTAVYKATQPIYDTYLLGEDKTGPGRSGLYEDAIRRSAAFAEIYETRHSWEKIYSAADYLKLLNTFSDHRSFSEPARTSFLRAISDVIERTGGAVLRKYETQVLLARRI
jgi:SAM-dependent methyltransferase